MLIEFENFGRAAKGRVITHKGDLALVWANNPTGGANLVLVDYDRDLPRALRHGNLQAVSAFVNWAGADRRTWRAYRRARKFLAEKGIGRDWYVERA